MKKPLTTLEFVKRAQNKHGYRYNYDKVNYKLNNVKVEIMCKEHGSFFQSPEKHLRGQGCSKCANNLKWSSNDFITEAKKVHGNRYNYSKSIYRSKNHKIIIICNVHGEFEQIAKSHLHGHGCSQCNGGVKHNLKYFILKAKNVHGDKFDYNKSIYINDNHKITIKCNSCNKYFNQKVSNHLQGQGCPKCNCHKIITSDLFLERAKFIHKNKYDYSNIKISGVDNKVEIICHNHSPSFIFHQTPYKHINIGRGCPKCNKVVSNPETLWLDSLGILKENRQISLPGISKRFKVDGYDPKTKTVYEFYGDFWHGNPQLYKQDDMHPRLKKTFGDIYNKTKRREDMIKKAGYKLITIWENDYHEGLL